MLITQKNDNVHFLNIYNNSKTFANVKYIIDYADLLLWITAIVGDFNLRHPIWDSQEKYNQCCLKHLYQA